ncbi:MAG: LPS export ABC transporter ATP-binding protein [bacterium TMED161]|nr:MAG: LPS export ABC transporter ATP-binding protein [bacterium TMED161]|tara:strand:+ start:187 stop:918 length:732 start_codon:yes stop_codon:yes gene_type:complete
MSCLSTNQLVKKYKKAEVVRGVSIQINEGEIVGLLGPNGAGKTTTFYMITGMITPSSGAVQLDGNSITNMPMYKRARLGIGYLAQEASVFTKLSVEDNLRLALELTRLSRNDQKKRLEKLLDEFSIGHIRNNIAMTLSGGERRRTEIARALVSDPKFILLDEPYAGIDPIAVDEIQNIILDLKSRGIGVLITDHNVRETLSITDRSYLLYDGKVLFSGTSKELSNNQEAKRLYLGDSFKMEDE